MYFNNVHILIYFILIIVGFIVGKFVAWMNYRFPNDKKIFSRDFFSENKDGNISYSYVMMFVLQRSLTQGVIVSSKRQNIVGIIQYYSTVDIKSCQDTAE